MTTTPEYDAILARKLAEREAKGNISSQKLTESEMASEINKVTEGSFTSKGGEVFDYKISPDGKEVTIQGTDRGTKILTDGPHALPEAIQPKGYVTKSGRVYKSKPGRKPKDAK